MFWQKCGILETHLNKEEHVVTKRNQMSLLVSWFFLWLRSIQYTIWDQMPTIMDSNTLGNLIKSNDKVILSFKAAGLVYEYIISFDCCEAW